MMYPGNADAYPSYPDSVHSGNSGDTYSTASELAQYNNNGYYNSTHGTNEEGCLDKSYESSLSEGEDLCYILTNLHPKLLPIFPSTKYTAF